jgi:hypothetical protein
MEAQRCAIPYFGLQDSQWYLHRGNSAIAPVMFLVMFAKKAQKSYDALIREHLASQPMVRYSDTQGKM